MRRAPHLIDLTPSPVTVLRARLAQLERPERSLMLALASHRMSHRRRRAICERLEALGQAIVNARELLARLHCNGMGRVAIDNAAALGSESALTKRGLATT